MRLTSLIPISLMLVGVAACSPGNSVIGSGPQGVRSTGSNAASQAPQSPNSLPENTTVSGPLTTGMGRIGTTSVQARPGF